MEPLFAHLAELLLAVIAALLARYLPVARAWIDDWLARQRLETALGRAAGLVLLDPAVRNRGLDALGEALRVGEEYLAQSIPDTLKRLGVTPDRLKLMLRGQVGKPETGR